MALRQTQQYNIIIPVVPVVPSINHNLTKEENINLEANVINKKEYKEYNSNAIIQECNNQIKRITSKNEENVKRKKYAFFEKEKNDIVYKRNTSSLDYFFNLSKDKNKEILSKSIDKSIDKHIDKNIDKTTEKTREKSSNNNTIKDNKDIKDSNDNKINKNTIENKENKDPFKLSSILKRNRKNNQNSILEYTTKKTNNSNQQKLDLSSEINIKQIENIEGSINSTNSTNSTNYTNNTNNTNNTTYRETIISNNSFPYSDNTGSKSIIMNDINEINVSNLSNENPLDENEKPSFLLRKIQSYSQKYEKLKR